MTKKLFKSLSSIIALAVLSASSANAQSVLQFTSVNATPEKAIQLHWASISNEVYEIDEADALIDTNTGSITWNKLYDNYPSQGTNTFWLDTGNYNLAPQMLHPKNMPMRFYRIVDLGADSLADKPSVTIDSITNNTLVSGELTFTVTASTDQPGLRGTLLYVDGQEMQAADSITNFTVGSTNYETDTYSINTCEWLNGTHILFATTEAGSSYSSQLASGPLTTAHAVSSFVPVLFNNLVEGISFSQPSFDPSSGQTQQVSAVFPLNSDWTLNIVDVYSNVVQTATGSGNSMLYNWDGTANGTNLPNGIYYYYITAATNGLANALVAGGSGGGSGGSPSLPSFARSSAISSDSSELWAVAPDSENIVPFALYPQGFDTNGFTIFRASPSEVEALTAASRSESIVAMDSSGSASPNGIGDPGYVTPLPDPQPAPPSPQRPPNNPVRGLMGTIGIATDTFTANGTNSISAPALDNGLHVGLHISMEGNTGSTSWPPRPEHKAEVDAFVKTMQFYGWSNPLNKIDGQLSINDLRGSGTPFNNVNMGVFIGHGTYGTGSSGIDYAANMCLQMYFPITSGGSAQMLRFSEMNLGGAGTNGLKWMVIDACHSLQHNNWNSMKNKGIKPYNSNLHLILGGDTTTWTSARKWYNLARYLNYGRHNFYSPYTIRDGYYQANTDAFQNSQLPPSTVITLAVAGDSACLDDSFQTNTPPSGSWQYDSLQIFSN